MKKILIAFGFLALFSGRASAAEFVYEKAYSSATATGVTCTTGTVVRIDGAGTSMTALSGTVSGGYRFQNQHASCTVWIGYGATVSSSAVSGLGIQLVAGKDGVFPVGYDSDRRAMVPVVCLAADACGVNGANLSREVFGSR